jgi:hypothetical protein
MSTNSYFQRRRRVRGALCSCAALARCSGCNTERRAEQMDGPWHPLDAACVACRHKQEQETAAQGACCIYLQKCGSTRLKTARYRLSPVSLSSLSLCPCVMMTEAHTPPYRVCGCVSKNLVTEKVLFVVNGYIPCQIDGNVTCVHFGKEPVQCPPTPVTPKYAHLKMLRISSKNNYFWSCCRVTDENGSVRGPPHGIK